MILRGTMGSRMRKNKSQRDQRRSQIHATLPRLSTDPETGSTHLRHRVDMKTGMYRGRQVLNVANSQSVTATNTKDDTSDTTSQNTKADSKKETAGKK